MARASDTLGMLYGIAKLALGKVKYLEVKILFTLI